MPRRVCRSLVAGTVIVLLDIFVLLGRVQEIPSTEHRVRLARGAILTKPILLIKR